MHQHRPSVLPCEGGRIGQGGDQVDAHVLGIGQGLQVLGLRIVPACEGGRIGQGGDQVDASITSTTALDTFRQTWS